MNITKTCHHIASLLTLSLAVTSSPSMAQDNPPVELESCSTATFDPDGDGFGWDIFSGSSCRITENSTPAPVITNLESGQPVLLERAFWDANADLANRTLHCRHFEWSDDDSQYQSSRENWYWFRSLPEQPPWISDYYSDVEFVDQNTIDDNQVPFQWSVVSGLFTSRSRQEPFMEEFYSARNWIERFTSNNGQAGVRFWGGRTFSQCLDTSGAPFGPTGHWDQPATTLPSPFAETPLYFTGEEEPYPEVTNLETGQAVQFETGTWEFQADLSYRDVYCTNMVWDARQSEYHEVQYNSGFNDDVTYHPKLANSRTNEGWAWLLYDHRRYTPKWTVEGENFSSPSRLANSMWYEPIEKIFSNEIGRIKGVRYWGSPDDTPEDRSQRYSDCYASERPPRGIYSFDVGPVVDFKPRQDIPIPDIEPPATGNNGTDQNMPDSTPTVSLDNDADATATDSNISPTSPQNVTEPSSGGGSFSLLFLCLAIFRNRLYRMVKLTGKTFHR